MKRKFKILYINHASRISGAERCMLRILDDIDRNSFEPFLVCPEGDLASEAETRDTTVFRMPFVDYQSNRSNIRGRSVPNPFVALGHACWLLSIGRRIAKIIRQSYIDMVHANTLLARIPSQLGGIFSKTPVIWHIRDILPSRLWRALYNSAANSGISGIISVSDACRSQFSDQSKIWTVHDGISSDVFRERPEEASALRTIFGWGQQEVVFGIFGRITEWKGHREFIEAAIEINRRFPETRWLVVGEAWSEQEMNFEKELRAEAVQGGLGERLIFTGFRNDVNNLMSTCDVVVVPSILPDPFPNTVLEGMSCSRAVLAFPVGGIPEAIEDGVSGRLVPENTASSLASAMAEMIKDPVLRHKIGINARRRVIENFNPAKTQRSIEQVYHLILKNEI